MARLTSHFQVGVTGLATQAAYGWTLGPPGGLTQASVKVLNGALVQTDHTTTGLGTFSAGATGKERAIVDFTVQGAGSRFEVLGQDGLGSDLLTGTWNAQGASVNLAVLDGGVLALKSATTTAPLVSLAGLAGNTRLQVRGAGSRVDTTGTNPFITVGTGSQASGSMRVANGGGTGILSLSNGSQLLIHADGQGRGKLAVGVADFAPGGVGVMRVDSGSTVSVTGGSSLATSHIGVGAFDGGDTGGVGTLTDNLINRGSFNPGNSPGTLHLQASFENQAGGQLVLEVESDGHGSFVTDQLVFDAGSVVSLGPVQIEFRFLGATDPNAFQASGGFQIDSFLRQGADGLDHALLGGASYSASSAAYQFTWFMFSAEGGAVFQEQAVPEPQSWGMLHAGLLAMGRAVRRKSTADNRGQAG